MKVKSIKHATLAFAAAAVIAGCSQPADQSAATSSGDGKSQTMADHSGMSNQGSASQQLHDLMMRPMQNMNMSGNVDKDFATMMVEHHQQAIDMAKVEVESGKNDRLKEIAQNIIETQQAEIDKLNQIASSLSNEATDKDASNKMHMAMMQPMSNMNVSGDVDKDFAAMMAVHHDMAIKMAEIEIKAGKNAELKAMAQKMQEDQTKEKAELLAIAKGS